jgi:uncharacterized protein YbcV (DUF1398 family)
MFTIEQIKEIHSKVRSGADFPRYVQEIKKLGVTSYEIFVKDGHAIYKGQNDFSISSDSKWPDKEIAGPASAEKLEHCLKIHQLGKTDYLTFCQQAADSGVEKWKVDTAKMKCTYYDKDENTLLEEDIPMPA